MTTIRDIRQTAILDAARDLFSRQGFHKTTMPEIARAAEVSVGLIYYHFASKADILVAIVKEFHAAGMAAIRNASVSADPCERLDVTVRDLFTAYDHFSKIFLILYKDLSSLSREERQRIYALEDETAQHLHEVIQDGQRAGVFVTDLPTVPLIATNIVSLGQMWALKKTWYFADRMTLAEYTDMQLQYLHRLLLHHHTGDECIDR